MALSYFTLEDLRALPNMADVVKYPNARLTAAGEWIEGVIEREVGASFVARQVTETLDGDDQDPRGGLVLSKPHVLEVTAITSNGAVFDAAALGEVDVRAGVMRRHAAGDYTGFRAWDAGVRNIDVTYNAGYSVAPPGDIKDAALQGARYRVLRTSAGAGISERATSVATELGNVQLSTAGKDRPTGVPEVDAVIIDWRDKLDVYGFA